MGDDNIIRTVIEIDLNDKSGAALARLDALRDKIRDLNKSSVEQGADREESAEVAARMKAEFGDLGETGKKAGQEAAEGFRLPRYELRVLASEMGRDIPGSSEIMRGAFMATSEKMVAGMLVVIGALEATREGMKELADGIKSGIEDADKYSAMQRQVAADLRNLVADAANEAAIRIRHLRDNYDELKVAMDASIAASQNNLSATNTERDAQEKLTTAIINRKKAEGLIPPDQADAQSAQAKLNADIARQNAQNAQAQQEIDAKKRTVAEAAAEQKRIETLLLPEVPGGQGAAQASIDAQVKAAEDHQQWLKSKYEELNKAADALEAEQKKLAEGTFFGNILTDPVNWAKSVFGSSQRDAAFARRQAEAFAPDQAQAGIDELKRQQAATKADTDAMVSRSKELDGMILSLSDAIDASVKKLNSTIASQADANEKAQQAMIQDMVTKFIDAAKSSYPAGSTSPTRTPNEVLGREIADASRLLEEHNRGVSNDDKIRKLIELIRQVHATGQVAIAAQNQEISDLKALVGHAY